MEVDLSGFSRSLRNYRAATKKTWKESIYFAARRVAQKLVMITPPKNKKQGTVAVGRDTKRAAAAVKSGFLSWLRESETSTGSSVAAFLRRADGTPLGIDWPAVSESEAEVRTFHERRRDKRGRVRRPDTRGIAADSWSEPERIVTTGESFQGDLRPREENVGMAKGGWVSVLRLVGGRAAAWFGKYSSLGGYRDMASSKLRPRIVFWNTARHIGALVAHRMRWVYSSTAADLIRQMKRETGQDAGRFSRSR